MKALIKVCLLLLGLATSISAYFFEFYTRSRMGMYRWVVYQRGQLEDLLSLKTLTIILLVLSIMVVLSLSLALKRKDFLSKGTLPLMILSVWLNLYLFAFKAEHLRSTYFPVLLISLGSILLGVSYLIPIKKRP